MTGLAKTPTAPPMDMTAMITSTAMTPLPLRPPTRPPMMPFIVPVWLRTSTAAPQKNTIDIIEADWIMPLTIALNTS